MIDVKKETIVLVCLVNLIISCVTIKKDSYNDINTFKSSYYTIEKVSSEEHELPCTIDQRTRELKSCACFLSSTIDTLYFFQRPLNHKFKGFVSSYSLDEYLLDSISTKGDDVVAKFHSINYQPAYYSKAKELYYKELLVEMDSLPLTKKDSIEIIDYGKVDLEESKRMLKQKNVRKWVYATITMPKETLNIKYVQGGNSAFFGTDSLYQKGVLFFFTGSNHEVNKDYSGLYVIRPKEVEK